jgi:hypothetical protein
MAFTPAPRWSFQNDRSSGPKSVVAGRVVGHGARELDVEAGGLGAALDLLAPVRVDLSREVHLPRHGPGMLSA